MSRISHCDQHPTYTPEQGHPGNYCVYCMIMWHDEQRERSELAAQAKYRVSLAKLKDYTRRLKKGAKLNKEEWQEIINWATSGIHAESEQF